MVKAYHFLRNNFKDLPFWLIELCIFSAFGTVFLISKLFQPFQTQLF